MSNKYDGTHFLVMYLAGYGFYAYQIYAQILYSYHGMELIIPLSIAAIIMPFIIFYVVKKLNNNSALNPRLHFTYTILNLLYLAIVGIITLNYMCVMVHNYYYQSVSSYIIAIFFMIPILYILFKNSKVYYSLSFILLLIFFIFNSIYVVNHEVAEFFPLSNTLNIKNPLVLIILVIPILLEPLLLLSNNNFIDRTKKINTPFIVVLAIIMSLIGIYTVIREGMEFGMLLETISFPYFESGKFMSIETNFDNIDYFYLFWLTMALFSRLPMLYLNIKENFKIKTKGIIIIFILTIGVFYYLQLKLEFYRTIIVPTLIACSIILIILLFLSFFTKRRLKNVIN